MIPDSEVKIMEKYYHGEYSVNHPEQYAGMVAAMIENDMH